MTFPHALSTDGRRPAGMPGRGVTAVLGPTNTGKTHLAIERMLGHESGMIGLPLRLLAREVYGRLVEKVGREAVALVTGEEKIKPKKPRYWVSTVEAMPRDVDVSFCAIDEIQLIADPDRGHVFTEAMLNRRGRAETMLLGAATARPIIEAVLPGVLVASRPRLSQLSFAGEKKITRLPPRSAVIAFSAEEVYAIAELVRRQRGGAAVVMGSLSPRTRNAQVAMFQAGEVDHLVATDAIGMGLNLEIGHVAFAADRKFDGHRHRRLFASEFAQIAGRAGRAQRDGTFGTTGRCPEFDEELVEALENHAFEPLTLAEWRNSALDFASLARLEASLAMPPGLPELVRARKAEDEVTLDILSTRPNIRRLAGSADEVHRLWDLCQLPDYRKVSPHIHADMVGQLYEMILAKGAIERDFFASELNLLDRIDGDIETLSFRLAQVRTWSYCANRPDWLRDPEHWQNVARALEDKLSDALHEKLMQRFVDRRTSVLMRRLKENVMLEAEVSPTGDVLVAGQHVGRLEGFRFTADPNAEGAEAKALRAAAAKALGSEIETRATRLSTANDDQLTLSLDGVIRFIGEPIAVLQAGTKALEPRFLVLADEQLAGLHRELVETRLAAWLKAHVAKLLGPLALLEAGEPLTGIARGIAFRVAEALGVLDRAQVANDVRALDQNARAELRKLGLRFGAHHLFVPLTMKPGPRSLAAQLHLLMKGGEPAALREVSHLAFSGRTSIPVDPAIDRELYRVAGFRVAGPRAIRVDILERLADLIRPAIAYRPGVTEGEPPAGAADGDAFVVTGAMTSLVGCAGADFGEILKSLGYRMESRPGPAITVPIKRAAPKVAEAAPPAEAAEAEAAAEAAEPAGDSGQAPEDAAAQPEAAHPGEPDSPAEPETISGADASPAQSIAADASGDIATADAPAEADVPAEPDVAAKVDEPQEALAAIADPAETPAAAETPAEVPTIEVWRMGRPERPRGERGRDRHQRGQRPGGDRPPQGKEGGDGKGRPFQPRREWKPRRPETPPGDAAAAALPATAEAGAGAAVNARPEGRRPDFRRPDRKPEFRKPDQPGRDGQPRPDGARPFGGKGDRRDEKRGRTDRKGGDGGATRIFHQDRKPANEKAIDPDSPFAALLALKSKLEGKP